LSAGCGDNLTGLGHEDDPTLASMTGGYLHGLPSANGWRRGGTLDDTSWLVPSRISLGATHSRGCNRRPMHAALKIQPNGWEVCCRHGVSAGRIGNTNRRTVLTTIRSDGAQCRCSSSLKKIVPA
jgi:hypothetical protein